MTPSYEELLTGSTTWNFKYKNLHYSIKHHSHRRGDEYEWSTPHPGTWCYYLHIPEEMYPKHRWPAIRTVRDKHGYFDAGPAFDTIEFHGGITFAETSKYFNRKLQRTFELVKVGCDYNHLWDEEAGYPDTLESVKRDAENSAKQFLDQNPDFNLCSAWSGIYDRPDQFYTAQNGRLVHITDKIPPEYKGWERQEQ